MLVNSNKHAMIAPNMAPMEPAQLSSNWKRLQATLQKKVPNEQESLKRKRPDATKQKTAKKRQKIDTPSGTSRKSKAPMNGTNGLHKLRLSKSASSLKAITNQNSADEDEEELERPSSALDSPPAQLREADVQVNEGVSQTALAGKYLALDCEMVGYGPTPRDDSEVARVSLVNYHGEQIYDTFVLPQVPVTDYRTHITGITETTLAQGRPFKEVQRDVSTFLSGRVLIGHALKKDLEVLMLSHPRRDIRDTSRHAAFRALSMGKTPALKLLCKEVLGLEIQQGHHSSVEDARAAMLLYRKEKDNFEAEYAGKFGRKAMLRSADGIVLSGAGTGKKKKQKKGKK
jgi:RNA exonuclease 4